MLLTRRSLCAAACALLGVTVAASPATADKFVNGHFKSNGTYVAPYMRSDADGNFYNNWSTKPNINPYKGTMGTRVTPPNKSKPSYSFGSGSFALPATAAPRPSIVTTPFYGSASLPSADDCLAAEAARAAAIAAAAKAHSDAKAQALATARANSNQRRNAFAHELEVERSKSAAHLDARKAGIVAEHAQRETAIVESDKSELRIRYRELVDQFDREQAATSQRFTTAIASKREQLSNYYDDRQSIAAQLEVGRTRTRGEPTLAQLFRDEERENEQKLESKIVSWTDRFARTTASDRIEFVARTTAFVQGELAKRSEQRLAERDQRLLALKTAHDQDLSLRISKLKSEFERAEGERFAADQERAERRFLALVHGSSVDRTIEAEPVPYCYPATGTQSANGSALRVAVVAGLGLLLALGAILSFRPKTTDFRHGPPGK